MIEIRVQPSTSCFGAFFAWGKVGEITTDCPVKEPGEVWFNWADTHAEAFRKVHDEIEAHLNNSEVRGGL